MIRLSCWIGAGGCAADDRARPDRGREDTVPTSQPSLAAGLEVAAAVGPDFPNAAPALLEHFRMGEVRRDRGTGLIKACFGRRRTRPVNGDGAREQGGWFAFVSPANPTGGTVRQPRAH